MYYVGYTSVISGGEDKTIYDYIKYMYGSEDKKSVDYDLNYFFQQMEIIFNYVMKTSEKCPKDSYMPNIRHRMLCEEVLL